MNISVDIDEEDVLRSMSLKELLEWCLDMYSPEEVKDTLEDVSWSEAEDNYDKYHQDNMLDQSKLDLFLAHIKNISLEDVEKLVGSKF